MQYGYVRGGLVPTLDDCGTVDGYPVIMERSPQRGVRQRVFGISWERVNLRTKQGFIVTRRAGGYQKLVLMGKVLLLCRLSSS